MKNLRYFVFIICSLMLSATAVADHTLEYESKLVTLDVSALKEPPTKFEVKVKLKTKSKIDNPFTEQMLRDAMTPVLNDAKEQIEEIMNNTNELIMSGDISEEEAEELVEKLNNLIGGIIEQAENKAERRVESAWKKLVKEDKTLRDWKIDTSVKVGKSTFSLVKGIVSAVGSGGISLVKDIIGIIGDAIDIASNLADLLKGEESARNDLESAMDSVDKKLKGEERGIIDNMKDFFKGSENDLEEKLDLYEKKWIAARQEAEKLAKEVNKVLDKQDELKKLAKEEGGDVAGALEQVEKMTENYLKSIDGLNDSRAIGESMLKSGKAMLTLARESQGTLSTLRDTLKKVYDGYKQIKTLLDPIDGPVEVGTAAATLAAKKLGDYAASKQ